MDFSQLLKMDIQDLRVLAAKYGLKIGGRAKAATIARQIMDVVAKQSEPELKPQTGEIKHPAQEPTPEAVMHSEADIREACKRFFEIDGYEVEFNDDGTWHFSFRGAEDSGHMSVPLRVIRMKAENVSRGARNPARMNFDGDIILSA